MDKTRMEDDCVDSGAETAGSDYSPLSSTSIKGLRDFMADPQDPYLVSVHLIADPDHGGFLQHATDTVLSWIHPDLQLFRVSERAHRSKKRAQNHPATSSCTQPALAVILFLQESYGGEEHILSLHRALQRPPWRFHHTEKVSNGKRMLPLTPCSQDFFTLTPGTPLWAVRQVHYGKEIVRFTVYCRHQNYGHMVRLYKLLLHKRLAQKKDDFCFFVVFSNADLEIQLSLKRLHRASVPAALDSALLEVRVRDVGALVPLLPHTCRPISELRWQTQDYDGNKILLQVQPQLIQHPDSFFLQHDSTSAPSTCARHSAPYRQQQQRRRPHRSASFHSSRLQSSQTSLPSAYDYLHPTLDRSDPELTGKVTVTHDWNHCGSLFTLPNISRCSARNYPKTPSTDQAPPFRLNVDALMGAEETDVDTGDKVSMDLSVVSGYIQASLSLKSRPVSAPPEEIVPSRSPSLSDVSGVYKAATMGGRSGVSRSNSLGVRNGRCGSLELLETSTSPSSLSINHSDSCSIDDDKVEDDEEEFYI